MSRTKNDIIDIYRTLKAQADGAPLQCRDFLKKSAIPRRELEALFGASAYSKLQELAGDAPNRLDLQATPLLDIMSNYGDLALDVLRAEGRLPVAAHWRQKDLRPTESGLSKSHGIKWTEFPKRFEDFCTVDNSLESKYKLVLEYIREHLEMASPKRVDAHSVLLEKVCVEINSWAPALRRNSEESYKAELSSHLRDNSKTIRDAGLAVREERGDSQCDIAVGGEVGIEMKKSPSQSDYDRCFGQVARHLQVYKSVVVVIFDVPRRDSFEDFNKLVDLYFADRVRVIRNG